jgi:all-trans-8'-apo-beta-carotenal 15,15'-oxygenase
MRQKYAHRSILLPLTAFLLSGNGIITDGFQPLQLCPNSQQQPTYTKVDPTTTRLKASTVTSDDEASGSEVNTKHDNESLQQQLLPDMDAYASAYTTVFKELPYKECIPALGTVPEDLIGSYFRCGPAMFSAGSLVPPKTSIVQPKQQPVPDGVDLDRMVVHPFEGDGAILGITFTKDRKVVVRYRYVRTAALTRERKKGSRVYTAMDSTRKMGPSCGAGVGNDFPVPLFRHHLQPGLNKSRKNTSNTRAIYWGKRLFTMFEGSQPYKLDARALSTEGRSRLGGAIRRDADPLGTKMSYDAQSNRALFYSVDQNGINTDLTLLEFDSTFRLVDDAGKGTGRSSYELPGFALINDFCSTKTFAIFIQPHVNVNPIQFLTGKEPGKTLTVDVNSPAKLHLIPRVGTGAKQQCISIPLEGPYEANIQFCNAYEIDNIVTIDAILSDGKSRMNTSTEQPMLSWPWGRTLNEYKSIASKKSLWRYTIDTKLGTVAKRLLYNDQCYFGTINPMVSSIRHRYIYLNIGILGSEVSPPQGIATFDSYDNKVIQIWKPEIYEFCGEPIYSPKSPFVSATTIENGNKQGWKEDDQENGYILSTLYNGRTKESELLIFEASDIGSGPITRIPLGMSVPHGYYGCYTCDPEQVIGSSAEEIDRRVKLMDKMESRGNRWNEVKSDFSGLGLRFDDMEEYFGDWNPFD